MEGRDGSSVIEDLFINSVMQYQIIFCRSVVMRLGNLLVLPMSGTIVRYPIVTDT